MWLGKRSRCFLCYFLVFVSIHLTLSCVGFLGLCKVDETPKGWYIQYIDRDPETIRRQQEQERKKKQDLDDEEKTAKFIEQQVRRGLEGKELVRKIIYQSSTQKFSQLN